jgi:hypothetical protein
MLPPMKAIVTRLLAAVALVALAVVLAGAAATASRPAQPDKLVILSTVDVKGKTSPCG